MQRVGGEGEREGGRETDASVEKGFLFETTATHSKRTRTLSSLLFSSLFSPHSHFTFSLGLGPSLSR